MDRLSSSSTANQIRLEKGKGMNCGESVVLRVPKLFDLHADPFERAEYEGIDDSHWRIDRIYLLVPAQAYVTGWLSSFKQFPPRQRPASFNLEPGYDPTGKRRKFRKLSGG